MLIKMRESKGFTLVELMIVVAIIGILAAVAIPYYQRYVMKSRLASLVLPGVHAIETNLTTFYATQNRMPAGGSIANYCGDANTQYIGTPTWDGVNLAITIPQSGPFSTLTTNHITGVAQISGNKVVWGYSGTLATELGL
jgi:type IV pilus assembly protein PilA